MRNQCRYYKTSDIGILLSDRFSSPKKTFARFLSGNHFYHRIKAKVETPFARLIYPVRLILSSMVGTDIGNKIGRASFLFGYYVLIINRLLNKGIGDTNKNGSTNIELLFS